MQFLPLSIQILNFYLEILHKNATFSKTPKYSNISQVLFIFSNFFAFSKISPFSNGHNPAKVYPE